MKGIYRAIFLALLLTVFLGITNYAQNMNEDFRKTAPAPLAPKQFNVPKPFETTLPNGLKVVIFEDKRLPIVSYRLAFRSGEINDPNGSRGLTSALAAMLNQGTTTRTSQQLAEEIEKLGASLGASSSSDNTVIAASALSMYSSDILKLLADMTLNPAFPEKELALYKQNTIEGLKVQRADAGFLANERISKVLYGAHPYSVTSPEQADIEKLSREKLMSFHKQMFVPNNGLMVIVGDVNREELLKELNVLFSNWSKGDVQKVTFPALPVRAEKTLTVVDRPGSVQSNIVLGNLAIERSNPDYFPILVMNQVLGAGASSRLFMNLRESKSYTYGAYSSFDSRRQAGAFEATAEVRTPVTGDSLKEFFYELGRIRDEKVSDKELQDAKNYLTGVFPLRAETQEGLTNLIVTQQLYDLSPDYLQTYRDKVSAVTAAEVQRVAQKYLTPDKIAIVVVGDAEEILKQIKPYASKVDAFDSEGKAVDISSYGKPAAAPSIDVTGKWNVMIEVQGQKLPVTLTLKQDGDKVSGSMESMLGKGEIAGGKIKGNKMTAVSKMEVQGQALELNLNATVENNQMTGTLTAPMLPGPANFTGTRDK